ncbi:MAG: DUF1893 domain-containing protein [Lachnospiraceae bacterium]|nr:DUF1893 domain-containing protein [Lachnospiraceae bacterium]
MIDLQAQENALLKAAAEAMEREEYSCVMNGPEGMFASREKGVKPLMAWIDEGRDFSGYAAADQVVGKAAALLYVKMGIGALYARLLSEKALGVLEENGIAFLAGEMVPYIINRRGDGMCPMEQSVLDTDNPAEAVVALKKRMAELAGGGK